MTRRVVVCAAFAALAITSSRGQSRSRDPFAPLKPSITFDDADRRHLDARHVVLKILPASGRELAVVAAASVKVDSDQLIAKVEDIAELKRSHLVPEIGRFSTQPTLANLDGLTLDDVDIEAVKDCRPGDCALKLGTNEIDALQRVIAHTGNQGLPAAINSQFRQIILDRVHAYLAHGLEGIPAYNTGDRQANLATVFLTLLRHSPLVTSGGLRFGGDLEHYPNGPRPSGEVTSFLYWSKETYAWRPIISVTHVAVVRPEQDPNAPDLVPELIVTSREVFATRYTSGALILTLLIRGSAPEAPHYLVYVSRTWVDAMRALWRPFVEHRVKTQAAKVYAAARDRIEEANSTPRRSR